MRDSPDAEVAPEMVLIRIPFLEEVTLLSEIMTLLTFFPLAMEPMEIPCPSELQSQEMPP